MAKDIAGYTDRQMMKDFDRMLDSFFGHGDRMPSVDIRQDKDSYVVRARVAGYRPDELNAYVEDHVLHIVGRRADEEKGGRKYITRERRYVEDHVLHIVGRRADEEKGNRKYITRERRSESFERSFTLPEDADEQRLEASCRKGVLELVVPKAR